MDWTKAQQTAIEFPRSDVLVSAAAGSGKTATLTERVLRALLKTDGTADIRRMLIVTYTNKAAFELRMKIRDKLENYLKDNPEDDNVRRQLTLLPSADISTIHSFYIRLLQKNFAVLGLPPKIGIGDESEFIQMRKSLLNELIGAYCDGEIKGEYEIKNPEKFFSSFTKAKTDDDLWKTFSDMYSKAASYREFLSYYKNCAETAKKAETDYLNSPYYAYIRSFVMRKLVYCRDTLEDIFDEYGGDVQFEKKYRPTLEECRDYLKTALDAFGGDDYEKARACAMLKPKFSGFKPVQGKPGFSEISKNVRDKLTKTATEIIPPLYSFDAGQTAAICRDTAEVYENVYKFLSNFDRLFLERKLKFKKLEYNDLERFAYKLLCGENGEPTPQAMEIGKKYDEIFVDEYQDVNSTQDALFAALSHNDRFMVGDIKQSIYGFRGAEPELFSEYRKRAQRRKPGEQTPDVLFLSENFRCGKPVVDFTNAVFSKLFGADTGEIPYSDSDGLVFSKAAPVREDVKVKVRISIGKNRDDDEKQYIADEILALLDHGTNDKGEPLKPSDISILCRKEKACEQIEQTLKERGIPVSVASKKGFFDAPEVMLAVSLLTAIDNPMRDIPLASVMRSPLFGFTADELALLRQNSKDAAFYESVEEYAKTENGAKCAEFIKTLSEYRKKSRKLPLEKFIRYLYGKTALMTLAFNKKDKGGKETRKANLRKMYDLARNFESGSYGGLSDFVTYCDNLIKNDSDGTPVPPAEDKDSVTVQTIHKSKGLEYPAVFLYSADTAFKMSNIKVINDRRLGIAVTTRNGVNIVNGPIYDAINAKYNDNSVRDEMRLLYVAVTRAKKYLYVTGKAAKAPDRSDSVSLEQIMECRNHLAMISLCIPEGETEYCVCTVSDAAEKEAAAAETPLIPEVSTYDEVFEAKVRRSISFEYPHKALSSVPNKVAVSKLYPAMLDDDVTVFDIDPDAAIPLILPDEEDMKKEAAASERGTATHLFMQFCDFEAAKENVKEEAARLAENGFFKEETVKLMYLDEIEKFFRSDLYKRMKDAENSGRLFYREFRFNIGLDAAEFTNDAEMKKALANETLLVQGVVDCFFEEEDGTVTVCDYKTDRIGKSAEAVDAFADRHRLQLAYYKKALERITKKKVGRLVLYSFCIGKEVEV